MTASVVTSSPVVGSSKISSSGLLISAMAMCDALLHAAAQFMRIALGDPLRIDQIDIVEHPHHARVGFGAVDTASAALSASVTCRPILIDGLSAAAAFWGTNLMRFAQSRRISAFRFAQQIFAVKVQLAAGFDASVAAEVAHQRQSDSRFARAGFADQADDLPMAQAASGNRARLGSIDCPRRGS